jgi:hypothetical protein
MRAAVDASLKRFGYHLYGNGSLAHHRVRRVGPMPPEFRALRSRPHREFTLNLDHVTTPTGFSYHPDGWHPYLACLEEQLAEPGLEYERSVLCDYFERFQPPTVQAALLENIQTPLAPLCDWPVLLQLFKHVWGLSPPQVRRLLARPAQAKGPRQQFGPVPPDTGRAHVRRLVSAYESLRDRGYDPDAYRDGALSGYFLARGDSYRFVVFHGNHRLAGMRLLGIDRVRAKLHPAHPPVVHEDHLERWTTQRGGLFELEVAQRLFDKLFTEQGRTKARNLGLLPASAT